MGKIISWLLMGVVVLVAKVAWNFVGFEELTPEQELELQSEWIAEENDWIAEEVAAGNAEPARGWFDQPNHGTFEASPEQLKQAIEDFHAAGAEAVWVVSPEEFQGAVLADGFAVELPAGESARERVFAVEAKLWGGEGTPDVGQRFLHVSLD